MGPSEEAANNNALDALSALSRRPGERSEGRPAAVFEPPVARVPRPAPVRPDRLENVVSEFVHRPIEPEMVPEPEDLRHDGMRRILISGVIGLAAAVILTSVGALLFGSFFPKQKDALQSFIAAAPPPPAHAQAQARAADDPSKLGQFRALLTQGGGSQGSSQASSHGSTPGASQASSPEQSEQLLREFEQWRQKAASTDKP
jgi:hypothetical protein